MPDPAPPPAPAACLDCGAPLSGPYCSQCGLAASEAADLSARRPFHGVLEDLIQYDGSIFRNLKSLLIRPGVLTNDFVAGRRKRHLPPARLYLLINFFFFFLVQWFDPITIEIVEETVGAEALVAAQARAGLATADFQATIEERIANAMPTWLFLLVPVFAGVLALLYLRRRRPFATHAALAFHFTSFTLVAFVPGTVLGGSLGEAVGEPIIEATLYLVLPLWLILACRRVYGQGWVRTVLKGLVGWFTFMVFLVLYFSVIYGWALGL